MLISRESELGVDQTVLYNVPAGKETSVTTIHVANTSGVARTFTIYLRPLGGSARPISTLNRALDVDEIAISDDAIKMAAGCYIEGIASGSGITCVITGIETNLT